MFGERFGIEEAKNLFGFEIWLRSLGRYNANGGAFAEGDFDNMADFKRFGRGVSKGIVCTMECLGGRNEVVVHKEILAC